MGLQMAKKCFGDPDRYTTSEKVFISCPDAAAQCNRECNGGHIIYVTWDPALRLFPLLGVDLPGYKRYASHNRGEGLVQQLIGWPCLQMPMCHQEDNSLPEFVFGLAPGLGSDPEVKFGTREQLPTTATQRFGDQCASINN